MHYILYLKNEVAMAKSVRTSKDNIPLDNFDNFMEVSKEQYDQISIPAKLVNGLWVKVTDKSELPSREKSSSENFISDEITMQQRLEALEAAMLEMALGE